MVNELGYVDDKGRQALKVTVRPDEPNNRGFYLDYTDDTIEVVHEDVGTCAIYPIEWLQEKFEDKFPQMVMVFADSEKRDGENISIMWMRTISTVSTETNSFELMREGIITLDLRMHLKESGANRNRGTAWRIMDESKLDRAFAERTPLLDDIDPEDYRDSGQTTLQATTTIS